MKNLSEQINDFYQYVDSFYNINYGVYRLTNKKTIIAACDDYLFTMDLSEVAFDSIDRERVRDILEIKYGCQEFKRKNTGGFIHFIKD